MITSPTIHLSVFTEPMVTGPQASQVETAPSVATSNVMNPFARRPRDKSLSRRERFGVLVMFAAVAMSLSAALVWADAQPRPARAPSSQTQPRV
jgi:hypothetical protein